MNEKNKKQKNIYDLDLHETLFVTEEIQFPNVQGVTEKKYEVTRVPGGWIYSFEYPMYRESPIVFVPYTDEFIIEVLKDK